MRNEESCLAYAKVNLHLAVGSPYEDGYHPIESIFTLVDLADDLTVFWEKQDRFSIEVFGLEAFCPKGSDTLTKAARLWYEATGFALGLTIHCKKRIPVKAGLGGGSSDAASLLLILQKIAKKNALCQDALVAIALKVGSDVPFFISGYRIALVEGRGEKIKKLVSRKMFILIVRPCSYAISTVAAYKAIDTNRIDGLFAVPRGLQEILDCFKKDSPYWKGMLYNDFQECTSYPEFYRALETLAEGYEGFGSLTGSGSCWFFVSEHEQSVLGLYNDVRGRFTEDVELWHTHLIC